MIAEKFGCPSIDLFASRLNKKLNRYISWIPDPFCVEVDAFFYDWSEEFPYIYPPFSLLNRCVTKCIQDEVKQGVVVFPLWPTQPWFPHLLELAISHIFLLPRDPPIYLPWQNEGERQLHPSFHNLNLATIMISTDPVKQIDFHHTLAISSQDHYEARLQPVTLATVANGLTFVRNNREIRILQL